MEKQYNCSWEDNYCMLQKELGYWARGVSDCQRALCSRRDQGDRGSVLRYLPVSFDNIQASDIHKQFELIY